MFQYDILPELNKALNGELFKEQGGGSITYLTIGTVTSTFDTANPLDGTATIPTQDIRDIIQAFVNWITSNNLQKYM